VAYKASIVADSISESGIRITTFVVTLWRAMLSELNTHRMFSRNSASSRAIPVFKQLRDIMLDPFIPQEFGVNKPGMQAGAPLTGALHQSAVRVWLDARDSAVMQALKMITSPEFIEAEIVAWNARGKDFTSFVLDIAERLEAKDPSIVERDDFLGIHKGLANRVLEPYMWHTVIITATELRNFFALRISPDAQQEIRIIAEMMKELYDNSTPTLLRGGEWHLPFLQEHEKEWAQQHPEEACRAVAARCARVSYLTHDTGEVDLTKDLALAKRLSDSGHMSPFEHVATPLVSGASWYEEDELEPETEPLEWSGNFRGWSQYRKALVNESDFSQVLVAQ
jgi:hypothetical protein